MQLQDIDVETICSLWKIPPIISIQEPLLGTINRIYLLITSGETFVLRATRFTAGKRERINAEQAITAYVKTHGLPAITPIPLAHHPNEVIYEQAGQLFTLFPYAPGYQVPRQQLTLAHATAMGEMLARLHQTLADYPHNQVPLRPLTINLQATLVKIKQLITVLQAKQEPEQLDICSLKKLQQRQSYLEHTLLTNPANANTITFLDAPQTIHGDYQEANLFFTQSNSNDRMVVSAIIDWEKVFVGPRTYEILRALNYCFQLKAEPTQAFLQAYCRLQALSQQQLETAAKAYGKIMDANIWVYTDYYLEHNIRTKPLLRQDPSDRFIPFAETWEQVQTSFIASLH